jgi:hypothetical protein
MKTRAHSLLIAALAWPLAACSGEPADACPDVAEVDPFVQQTLPDLTGGPPGNSCTTAAAAAATSAGPTGDRPLRHVFLIDHSASMYAEYPSKPSVVSWYAEVPEFADFVANRLGTNFRDGTDSAAVVAFNQYAYAWNGTSAATIDNGSGPTFEQLQLTSKADLRARVEALPPPQSGIAGFPSQAAQSSVMTEGLAAASTLLDAGTGEGVIWLVTDNIYDGSGKGSETIKTTEATLNRAFYEQLKNTAEYRVVVAYPMVHGTDGAWLKSNSLFVYGIYYDRDLTRSTPVEEVRRLLGDGAPGVLASAPLTQAMQGYAAQANPAPGRPFRFKPLDQDIVRIRLDADVEQVQKHREMGEKVKLKAKLTVENLLDHRVIDSVTFRVKNAKWVGYEPNKKATTGERMWAVRTDCPDTFTSAPVTVNFPPAQPGAPAPRAVTVEVPMEMPAVEVSLLGLEDVWEIAGNDNVIMGGALQAELSDVKSHMEIAPDAVSGIYGAQSLPEVFGNPQVCSYTAQFTGKTKKIENPGTIAAIAAIAGFAAIALLVLIGGWLLTSVSRRLYVDGVDLGARSIPRLRSTRVERGSELLGTVSLSFGGDIVLRPAKGFSIRKDGSGWALSRDGGSSVRVEFRTTRR